MLACKGLRDTLPHHPSSWTNDRICRRSETTVPNCITINRRILQEWHEIVLSNDSTPFKDCNTFVSYVATISLKVSL